MLMYKCTHLAGRTHVSHSSMHMLNIPHKQVLSSNSSSSPRMPTTLTVTLLPSPLTLILVAWTL